MKSTEKNLLIAALLGITFVFMWTFSNYQKTNKQQAEFKNYQENQETPEEKLQEKINSLPSITPIELKTSIFEENPPMIVDVRNDVSYKKGHIINSLHISALDINRSGGNIILVTENGNESTLLSLYNSLNEKNNQVRILTGGFNSWKSSVGTTVSFGDPSSFVDQSKIKLVEPRDVNEAYINHPESILIIDTRQKEEFTKGHVPGAINIPVSDLEKRNREVSMRKKIYVYGTEKFSSFTAGVMFYDLGFFNVETINGGFTAWEEYGYPIEIETTPEKNNQ